MPVYSEQKSAKRRLIMSLLPAIETAPERESVSCFPNSRFRLKLSKELEVLPRYKDIVELHYS